MKKPKKLKYTVEGGVEGGDAYERGYSESDCQWREYFSWYIKEKCIRREDLPSEEEIEKVLTETFFNTKIPLPEGCDCQICSTTRRTARAIFNLIRRNRNGRRIY